MFEKKNFLEKKNESLDEKNETLEEKNESLKEGRMKVSRTRIQIIVLKTLKRIIFLCRKLRKDDKFLRMSLGLHPQEIPQNLLSFLCFPHKNIIFSCSVPNRNGFSV